MLMNFGKYIETPTGKIVMSIILGLGLATLFKFSCKDKNCYIYNAPKIEELSDTNVYSFDGKCYVYKRNSITCDNKKETVNIVSSNGGGVV